MQDRLHSLIYKEATGKPTTTDLYKIRCLHIHANGSRDEPTLPATDWNHLDNTTDHVASIQQFKALAAATQHQ